MKLAEALVQRADLQKRIEQLRKRLKLSAQVQEGDQPPEDPAELLSEVERLLGEITGLIGTINRTNLSATLADGTTLTDALARRDALALHYSILSDLAEAATVEINRYSRSEIKSHPTVQVSALRKQMDALATRRRELDTAIQATNWNTDLTE
jgi:uncharacterized protein DUF6847